MPYIGASNVSQTSFKNLREKHSIRPSSSSKNYDLSGSSSKQSSMCEVSGIETNSDSTPGTTADSTANNSDCDLRSGSPRPLERWEEERDAASPLKATRAQSVGSIISHSTDVDTNELFTLPNESTHAYSYNPLSPNSLAVRLTILKRSLEILIRNPNMLGDQHHPRNPTGIDVDMSHIENDTTGKTGDKKMKSMVNLKQQKWSAHSAALNAFVTSTTASANVSGNVSAASSGVQTPATSGRTTGVGAGGSSFLSAPLKGGIPHLHRASSLAYLPHEAKRELKDDVYYNRISPSNSKDLINSQKTDLESLLELLNDALENNASERATDLHMISLLNINKLILCKVDPRDVKSSQAQLRTLNLKKTLLDSLAEPFFEHYNSNDEQTEDEGKELRREVGEISNKGAANESPISMSAIRPQQDYGRILHTFTSGKNIAPQAIFTCTQQHPWQFRAANDLACLTFGISKTALRALTLLDLIHTDSRNFVLNKIMSTEGQELVFTGEIVAIIQPGSSNTNSNLIWASFWAKRKNDLLVCVFQKVPCDYVDVMLDLQDYSVKNISGGGGLFWKDSEANQSTTDLETSPTFQLGSGSENESDLEETVSTNDSPEIKNTLRASKEKTVPKKELASPMGNTKTKKKSVKFADEIHDIKELSKSLGQLIEDVVEGKIISPDDDLLPMPIRVANHINYIRYFTLNDASNNIPCAVSCSILESDMKLKIHSLPYEAGLFVVDSHTLQLISCNKSILKNMFGRHFVELVGKPISEIIPSFADMIEYITMKYPALNITLNRNTGLVLTEHFFRKIQAESAHRDDDFYTSIGIDALHRDGNNIKIDFQLRVMNSGVILLWITHSRDVVFKDYTSTPSQLHMLRENELAYVSSENSSATSSKRSSSKISVDKLKDLASTSCNRSPSVEKILKPKPVSESSSLTLGGTPPSADATNEAAAMSIQVDDPELQRKLDLARMYTKDKSQFVKEGNFKLDEDLIKSITSTPQSTESNLSLNKLASGEISPSATTSNQSDHVPVFLTTPETNIGAQKHIKKFSDFLVLQKMGEGAYGKVNLCLHKKERYIVVIKMIFKERILVDTWVRDRKLGTIPSEIQIMAALNKNPDENILRLLDFFEDDDYYYIETPVHGETGCIDLFDLIELKTNMTEIEAKLIFKQVVSGIKHLHDQGIVHRDIKDENVIVDSKGFVKLIDFGSAAYVKSGPFDVFVGTIDYAAPEVLGGEPYEGKPQDIWAIGVLLYTIVFKENPFYNIDEILEGNLKFSNKSDVSEECVDLIKRILDKCAPKRPSIDTIYNDKWLQF